MEDYKEGTLTSLHYKSTSLEDNWSGTIVICLNMKSIVKYSTFVYVLEFQPRAGNFHRYLGLAHFPNHFQVASAKQQ